MDFGKMQSLLYDPCGKSRPLLTYPFDTSATLPADGNLEMENSTPRISANLTNSNLYHHTVNAEKENSIDQGYRGFSPHVEDIWESRNDDNPMAAGVEDVWETDNEDEPLADGVEDVWETENEDEPPADGVENVWEYDHKDELLANGVEDIWVSDHDTEPTADGVENNWESDHEDELESASDEVEANSQFVVSQSRITIDNAGPSFPLSDVWPDLDSSIAPTNSTLETPAPGSFRRYQEEDFSNLQDHMIEDKPSDSDSSEAEEE